MMDMSGMLRKVAILLGLCLAMASMVPEAQAAEAKVESRIGDLVFENDYPTAETVEKLNDELYTTAARLGGATGKIPSDRIVDGVDQTALLLLGEGHSRRDYMFYYSGPKLAAVRWMDIKALIEGPGHGGLPGLTMCNVVRDPGEKFCSMYPYLWTLSPFQNLVKSHMAMIEKFPNRKPELPEEAALTPHD